jgi:hypothetical protein
VLATETLTSFGPGFDVATARTAEEARTWMGTFDPELVLLDEAFSELVDDFHGGNGERRLVLLSSLPETGERGRYFEVLGKPLTLGSLLAVSKRCAQEAPNRRSG